MALFRIVPLVFFLDGSPLNCTACVFSGWLTPELYPSPLLQLIRLRYYSAHMERFGTRRPNRQFVLGGSLDPAEAKPGEGSKNCLRGESLAKPGEGLAFDSMANFEPGEAKPGEGRKSCLPTKQNIG